MCGGWGAGGADVQDDGAGLAGQAGSPDRLDALVWALTELIV
jgi:phage terminase large subunit-like protein